MGYERNGPVSGIKQKILGQIFKECGIKQSSYHHGFKRGVYLAMMYENGPEFLHSEIEEKDLKRKILWNEREDVMMMKRKRRIDPTRRKNVVK